MPTLTAAPPPRKFLLVEDIAAMYGISRRSVHEMTRTGRIPHRVLPHSRRCLFDLGHLAQWENGAELEKAEMLPHGGRVVRPKVTP